MFFNKARFFTHSRRAYGWFAKGCRPRMPIKIGYQNFYLYGAIDSGSGEHFSIIMPHVDSDCMNVYLSELSKEYENEKIALIMDQAGWHKAKCLAIRDNIKIVCLPPYSPELNPIERLWLYIKSNILNNRSYEKLELLIEDLYAFIQNLSEQQLNLFVPYHI